MINQYLKDCEERAEKARLGEASYTHEGPKTTVYFHAPSTFDDYIYVRKDAEKLTKMLRKAVEALENIAENTPDKWCNHRMSYTHGEPESWRTSLNDLARNTLKALDDES